MDEGFIGNILSGLISKEDGLGGSNGTIWIIFLFFLFFMNGGWGGNGWNNRDYVTQQNLADGFNFNSLENEVRANGRSISDLGYQNLSQSQNVINGLSNLNQSMNMVGADINRNVDGVRHDIDRTSCATNRNIDSVRYDMGQNTAGLGRAIDSVKYENAQNACGINRNLDAIRAEMAQQTCAITSNDTANTQKVLDKICQMEANAKDEVIAQLRSDLQAAQLTIGNAAQTANIVGAVRPYPVPAYPVTSPYGTVPYAVGTAVV